MMNTSIEFYATPDEQKSWFESLPSDNEVWYCVSQSPPTRYLGCVSRVEALERLDFVKRERIGATKLFLGFRDLVSAPVWRMTAGGHQEIDFVRSQAIQYDPCRTVNGHTLLEGQLAIMRPTYYRQLEIDVKPLQNYFERIVSSFTHLRATGATLIQYTSLGTVKEWPKVVVTRGAVEWERSGHLLKQILESEVEFEVRAP